MESTRYDLDYRTPGYGSRLEGHSLFLSKVQSLIKEEGIENFTCDITDVNGISSSSSIDYGIRDINAFPLRHAKRYISAITEQSLA